VRLVAAFLRTSTDALSEREFRLRDAIGRVSSYDWMVSLTFQPLAFAAVGPLAVSIGLAPTLLIAVAISGGANGLVLLVPDVRRLSRRESEMMERPASIATGVADPTEPR
jgi:hypothetical protein